MLKGMKRVKRLKPKKHSIPKRKCDQARQALEISEERFRYIFEYAPIGMCITTMDGRFHQVNQALCDLLGYAASELTALHFQNITYPEDLSGTLAMLNQLLQKDVPRLVMEKRYICKDGSLLYATVYVALFTDIHGNPLYYIGQIVDITERKEYERVIKQLAYYDSLTMLPNRMLFCDRLKLALLQAHANGHMLAVVFLDLDSFKEINDTLGHYAGDQALRIIGQRLTGAVRQSDIVARLGGDEFTVLLANILQEKDLPAILDKIREAIAQPIRIGEQEFIVTASSGVALYPRDGQDSDTLLQHADKAMYLCKKQKEEI
jgi:diguanylate cyclase (GGDEF)-like protein/PAS domain S-box-containing protein